MEYSNELLALFNPSQFQQSSNPDWLQSGSSVPIVADLESGENYEENLYHHSNKYPVNYAPSDNLANCFSINRRPISFNGTVQNDVLSHSSSTLGNLSQQQSQFLVPVEDSNHPPHYGIESERKINHLHPNYSEPELYAVRQTTPKMLPLETCQNTNIKRQRRASAQTSSSLSSTRRSSLITNVPVIDHYPNYTTSSPSKHWSSVSASSPRKKTKVFPSLYLGPYEGPKYRIPGPKKYELVRGIASGSTTRPPYLSLRTNVEYIPVELNIVGALVEEINKIPWNYEERQDGRRIIRLERRQYGHVVNAKFLVVGLAVENPTPEEAPPGVGVVEVSCLNYVLQEDDDDDGIRFSITSVEVVNIIEALIALTTMSLTLLRKEKGRIRLNLMPFWLKKPLSLKKSAMLEESDPRTDFARRIMRYEIRKPRGFDKDVRILSWDKLVSALHRALQCYYAEVPKEDLVDTSDQKISFFEKTA